MEGPEKNEREEIFSQAVRAGKRTYFFDVKATKRNDYYLTLTESKKRFRRDGSYFFEKHKIFLYKEDFEKFSEGLKAVIEFIEVNQPPIEPRESYNNRIAEERTFEEGNVVDEAVEEKQPEIENVEGEISQEDFTNIEFEDLDNKE